MSVTSALGVFVGRRDELEILALASDAAQSGSPRFAFIHGPSGIGKTTLAEHFLLQAGDLRVLRASGLEPERELRFGVAEQLLRAAGAPELELLAAQDTDPLLVGRRLLDVLGALQDDGAVLIALDDVQWADAASLDALAFLAHRLVDERALLLLSGRGEAPPEPLRRFFDHPHGVRLRLRAFRPSELRALAAGVGVELPQRSATLMWMHTEGVPLHARALLEELPADAWSGADVTLPAPRSYAALVARRLAACSPAARRLVEAVTVLGAGCSLADACAICDVDESFDAADEAASAGLLDAGDALALRFPSPLVAAAVAGALRPARRALLHRRAAALADDEGVALRHRAAAAAGRDDALADELDAYAQRALARWRPPAAADALLTASRLTADAGRRSERLLQAVDWTLDVGDLARARELGGELAALPSGARRDAVRASLAVAAGDVETATALLASAWASADAAADPALAGLIALRTARVALLDLRDRDVVSWCARARACAGDGARVEPAVAAAALGDGTHVEPDVHATALGDGALGRQAAALLAPALWRLGERRDAYAALAEAWPARGDPDPLLLATRGMLRCADDDLRRGRADLAAAIDAELRLGARGGAAVHLSALARACYAAGAWDDAVAAAGRALTITAELGEGRPRALARQAAIMVPAARGDGEAVAAGLAELPAAPSDVAERRVAAALTVALPAAARGDGAAVLAALAGVRALATRANVDAPGCWGWQDLYAEALVGAQRLAEAAAFLDAHEALAAERESASSIAKLARARGLLEAARERFEPATAAFERALAAIAGVAMPYEQALIRLAYGQHLRRGAHRRAAAEQLELARTTLAALRARPALERCERELVACGLNRRPAAPSRATARLTPQEQAVARMVVTGKTNREVASGLSLSVKTVEVHLTHIFFKLGIKSRTQLRDHAAVFDDAVAP